MLIDVRETDGVAELVITDDSGTRQNFEATVLGWRIDPGPGNSARVNPRDPWTLGSLSLGGNASGVIRVAELRYLENKFPNHHDVSLHVEGRRSVSASRGYAQIVDRLFLERYRDGAVGYPSRIARLWTRISTATESQEETLAVGFAGRRSDKLRPPNTDPIPRPEIWIGLVGDREVDALIADAIARFPQPAP